MTTFLKLLGVASLTLAFLIMPRTVSAHAEPARTMPDMEAELDSAPGSVQIWFTEEVEEGTIIEVFGRDGESVTAAPSEIDLFDPNRVRVTVALQPNLPPGTYSVRWTSVSAEDGDTDSGEFTFVVVDAATPVTAASPVASPEPATPIASPVGAITTPVDRTARPADLDTRALGIALGAGLLAAGLIYGFWRRVRPSPEERVDYRSTPDAA